MNDVLWVLVGVCIGGSIGLLLSGLLMSGKLDDLYREIQDLRFQRKVLRDELNKLTSPKPRPRTKRKLKKKK
ncbi:MAG: hypothetical protein H8E03_00850 [Pelagibacteraceae bacterium]|nr:hypothetical protein [Pelagibacteraceae bacterium]